MNKKEERNKIYALLSVYDKSGLVPLAKMLIKCGYGLLSSSGTAAFLRQNGLEVTEISDLTGYPAILGGRVKTLHPIVAGGILARRDNIKDEQDMEDHAIPKIDIVVCNLYPFEETAKAKAPLDELIEQIDIGGVALIRAAAKNYRHVGLLIDPSDYEEATRDLEMDGFFSLDLRLRGAIAAFAHTASYDAVIQEGLSAAAGDYTVLNEKKHVLPLKVSQELRYGENPHQDAALLLPPLAGNALNILSGKDMSYNNFLDIDAVLRGAAFYQSDCTCVIVKHTTPCGIAAGATTREAFMRAFACDPLSAFGGILSFTRKVDLQTAQLMTEEFFEAVYAPAYDDDAIAWFREKKPNLRVTSPAELKPFNKKYTSTWAGMLVQDDSLPPLPVESAGKWYGIARHDMWDDIIFAWKAAYLAKSNGIVVAKDGVTLGIGCGFPNRIEAVRHALKLAGEKAQGAALASDAFFPFYDSIELAAEAGIAVIIQPGGSIKDAEVTRRAQELGVSMFIGGTRTFRH